MLDESDIYHWEFVKSCLWLHSAPTGDGEFGPDSLAK